MSDQFDEQAEAALCWEKYLTSQQRSLRVAVALREQAEAHKAEVDDLKAERDVFNNETRMIAQFALPYAELECRKNPTHDTGEVLVTIKSAINRAGPIGSGTLIVQWMRDLRTELERTQTALGQANADLMGCRDGAMLRDLRHQYSQVLERAERAEAALRQQGAQDKA